MKLSEEAVCWLVRQKTVSEEDKELYIFAIEKMILRGVPFSIGLAFGFILGCVPETLFFEIVFLELRSITGGYHMKSKRLCLISSSLIILCCVYLISQSIVMGKWMLLIILCMAVFIMYNSPIENENKPLSESEKARQRVKARIIVSGLLIGIMGFSSMNETRFVTSI